jgi:hypothetical protein
MRSRPLLENIMKKELNMLPESLGTGGIFRRLRNYNHKAIIIIFVIIPIALSLYPTIDRMLTIKIYNLMFPFQTTSYDLDIGPFSVRIEYPSIDIIFYGQPSLGTTFVPLDVFLIPMFIYAIKPAIYDVRKYFEKKEYHNVLFEYKFLKHILYVSAPPVIVFNIITLVFYSEVYLFFHSSAFIIEMTLADMAIGELLNIILLLFTYFTFTVVAIIIWIVILNGRKEFNFHLAKAYFQNLVKQKDATSKVEYLISGIKSYDKYLRRSLNLQVNNIKEILSRLIIDSKINKNEVGQKLFASFGSLEDKLAPAICLSDISAIQEPKQFLVEESIVQRIKDVAIFFATIIPVALAIIQMLMPKD